MNFNIGDTVMKSGLGICKIKAIRKMEVEGVEQQFYVLQSGDVKVMVPFSFAHAGGLRFLLDEDAIEKILEFFHTPIRLPEEGAETTDLYGIQVDQAKEDIKQRRTDAIVEIVKTLFYKDKIVELAKAEAEIYQNALAAIAEEIAHIQHSSRQKIINRIKSALTEGRRTRRDHHVQR
ncbi:MAG: hypothetical protein C4527_14815 [Candidatus Omnitrophota bacterium]|jgi:RNA polymerase-interacting CarD/CdnL/TRCF family regulator|nr:MAG: hypothetical protein C4527_14815 [Candidatus Omnitrophota bacterium]